MPHRVTLTKIDRTLLREVFAQHGRTQSELAEAVGVSQKWVSDLINADTTNLDRRLRLHQVLSVVERLRESAEPSQRVSLDALIARFGAADEPSSMFADTVGPLSSESENYLDPADFGQAHIYRRLERFVQRGAWSALVQGPPLSGRSTIISEKLVRPLEKRGVPTVRYLCTEAALVPDAESPQARVRVYRGIARAICWKLRLGNGLRDDIRRIEAQHDLRGWIHDAWNEYKRPFHLVVERAESLGPAVQDDILFLPRLLDTLPLYLTVEATGQFAAGSASENSSAYYGVGVEVGPFCREQIEELCERWRVEAHDDVVGALEEFAKQVGGRAGVVHPAIEAIADQELSAAELAGVIDGLIGAATRASTEESRNGGSRDATLPLHSRLRQLSRATINALWNSTTPGASLAQMKDFAFPADGKYGSEGERAAYGRLLGITDDTRVGDLARWFRDKGNTLQ